MRIALFKSNSIISRLIRWFSRGDYSHAAIVTDSGTLYESREFIGVRRVDSLEEAMQDGDKVHLFEVPTTKAQDNAIIAFCEAQRGHKYDYGGIVRFLDRRSDEADFKAGTWFCSELVFAAFECAGIELLARTEPWRVYPDMLQRSPLTIDRGEFNQ